MFKVGFLPLEFKALYNPFQGDQQLKDDFRTITNDRAFGLGARTESLCSPGTATLDVACRRYLAITYEPYRKGRFLGMFVSFIN